MEKNAVAAAASSHGKPNSAGDQTAKSSTDRFQTGFTWKQVLVGGGIPGNKYSSVPKPTSLSASSAPMENPPLPEPVLPAPKHPEVADYSEKSTVAVSKEMRSVWKNPFTKVSAPAVDESTWPALSQLRKKPSSIPKHPAGGVSVVKEESKESPNPSARGNRNSGLARGPNPVQPVVHELAPKNKERGSSSRGPNPAMQSSVPMADEVAPNVLQPSSSETKLMAGSSGDSAAVSRTSKRRRSSRRRRNGSHRRGSRRDNNRGAPEQNNTSTVDSAGGTNPLVNLPFTAPPPPVRPYYGSPPFYPYHLPFMHHFIPPVPTGYHPAMPFHHLPTPIRPPPFIHHPALLPGNPLPSMIVNQIDFYFSEENLVKDEFLRSKMDNEGWVPVSLIATFPRVRRLTSSIPLILDSMRGSNVVEVKDDKLRKRHGWMKWVTRGLPLNVPAAGG